MALFHPSGRRHYFVFISIVLRGSCFSLLNDYLIFGIHSEEVFGDLWIF